MRIETLQYDSVPEDGQIHAGAIVPVDGKSWLGPPDGGCGIPRCPCFRGHFFMRLFLATIAALCLAISQSSTPGKRSTEPVTSRWSDWPGER